MAATAIVNIAIQIKLSMLLHFMLLQSLFLVQSSESLWFLNSQCL